MQVESYVTPGANDVLCGRGPTSFRHPGNHALRGKIADNLEKYVACTSRKAKTFLIHEIILSVMQEGGKFLQYNQQAHQWFDGGLDAAKNRVGSAFRDASVPGKEVRYAKDLSASSQRKRSFNRMLSSSPSSYAASNHLLCYDKPTLEYPCAETHLWPLKRQVNSCPASLTTLHIPVLKESSGFDPFNKEDIGNEEDLLDTLSASNIFELLDEEHPDSGAESPEEDYYPIAIFLPNSSIHVVKNQMS